MNKAVKLYPQKVFGTVGNFMAGNHLVQGWVCEHADFAEPKEDGDIVFCEACADAYEEGAEIQYQSNTTEDELHEKKQRISVSAFVHYLLKMQMPDKEEAVN